jgi:hypothetical protein
VLVREAWQATAPAQVPPPEAQVPADPRDELFPVPPDTREHGS